MLLPRMLLQVMADFGQTDFGQPFWRPSLAKPTLASVSVLVVWPTLAKTDFGQTDFGQIEFDLLCVVLCCVVCCLCGVGTCFTVSEWGFMCGCWFQGLVWTDLPGTALPLDRPRFRSFFPLLPQNSFYSSLSGCLLV